MKKTTITLVNKDWKKIIEGLSYANEQAEDQCRDDDAETYMMLIDLLTEKLDS